MTAVSLLPAEEARMRAVRALDVLDSPAEIAFDDLAESARAAAGAELALVTIVDSERLWFKACAGGRCHQLQRAQSLCHSIVSSHAPLVVLDTHKDARFAQSALVRGLPFVRFYAGAPIFCDGQAIGAVCVIDTAPRKKFAPETEQQLARFARIAGEMLSLRAKTRMPPPSPEGPARHFADEARRFARDYARLAAQVDDLSQAVSRAGPEEFAALKRSVGSLRDLALGADASAGAPLAEFCSPDSILDEVVEAARPAAARAGITIEYVRSFNDFLMLADPQALAVVIQLTLDCAIRQRGGPALQVRANFYDAQDGRRMLRLIVEGIAGLPEPCALAALAAAARTLGGGVTIAGDAVTLMVRAPLAGPSAFISMQADIDEQAG